MSNLPKLWINKSDARGLRELLDLLCPKISVIAKSRLLYNQIGIAYLGLSERRVLLVDLRVSKVYSELVSKKSSELQSIPAHEKLACACPIYFECSDGPFFAPKVDYLRSILRNLRHHCHSDRFLVALLYRRLVYPFP